LLGKLFVVKCYPQRFGVGDVKDFIS